MKVLECAKAGQTVPDEVFQNLSSEEQAAVRAFENTRQIEHRWREITIEILKTATDLSRGQDRMKVLEQLVHSSRAIIRSDVAYISLNKPGNDYTQVLVTSGVITEQFRNVLVPLGIGITGSVAATKQAAWTFDHGKDPKVSHIPHIDAAVEAEGLHGFLGAPLVNAGGVLGALMVGDRRPRHYTPDEIIILDSLASLASVALETAQLIEDLEENVTALRAAHLQSRQQVEQLEALSDADSQLMDVLSKGARTSDVREVLREKLKCEAWFWRDDQPYPANSNEAINVSDATLSTMEDLIAQSQKTGAIAVSDGISALAVSLKERRLGAICVEREVDDTQGFILHRASQTFATIILFREAVAEAENRQIDDLLRKMINGGAVDEDISRIKKITGIDLRHPDRLSMVVMRTVSQLPNTRTLNRLLGDDGYLFEHQGSLCAVMKTGRPIWEALEGVFGWGSENNILFFVGTAPFPPSASSRTEMTDAHSRASSLAKSMQALSLPNQVATASTFGSLGLLLSVGGDTIEKIILDGIGPLLSYDRKHATELTATAVQYFDSSRSVVDTARKMYVHENTIRQRLERIREVLGPNWNTGARAFDTHLALRAWKITR